MDENISVEKIWHPERNLPLAFLEIPPQSNKKYWWLGECGHEWEATMPAMRTVKNKCPYCGNRKLLSGFNDLETKYPKLAAELHPDKNSPTLPNEILAESRKRLWWQCEKGHEWETPLHIRTKQKTKCPYCAGSKIFTNFNDLKTLNPEIAKEWHPTKNNDIKIEHVGIGSGKKAWWLGECGHEWEAVISNRARKNSSGCPYCAGQRVLPGFNDFGTIDPEKAKFFHPEKNILSITEIGMNTSIPVWWKEPCGHEYLLSPFARHKALNCQVCISRVVQEGINNLSTTHPELAGQWHPTKNGELTPSKVTFGNPKKVWWLGECEHEWEISVNDRVRYQTDCPYCCNQKILKGFNDLATTHPFLANEWSHSKNQIKPTQVVSGTDLKIWWVCPKGHEWEATVGSRANQQTNCPACAGKRVSSGYNDLLTLNPELADQWHPTKNGELTPSKVAAYSSIHVWWQCSKGHEWETTVSSRHQGKGCKKCSSAKQASKGEKELLAYIESLSVPLVPNDRIALKTNQEIDIYLPEQNIAIEFNGLYWHSEASGKPKTYHYDKWLAAKNQGIQLIQIWEDDWDNNKPLIKQMLAHKIGVSHQAKIYARKLKINTYTANQAKNFLEDTHIQGWVSSTHYLGLETLDGEIVAMATFKIINPKIDKKFYLTRYATSKIIPGGFTKLLAFFEKEYLPTEIITFSDNTISDGSLYENNGFEENKKIKPDYYYFSGTKKIKEHKFLYRKSRFKNDPKLNYIDTLTESQLAALNKLLRIWDAGKIRWVKKYT